MTSVTTVDQALGLAERLYCIFLISMIVCQILDNFMIIINVVMNRDWITETMTLLFNVRNLLLHRCQVLK